MIWYINNPKSDMCPNRFYMAIGEVEIGEIKTLEEYNKHPLRFNDKEHQVDASFVKEKPWNLTAAAFNELRKNGVHFIVVHTPGDSEQVFLLGCQVITDNNFTAQAVKLIFCFERCYGKTEFTETNYLDIIKKYILEVEQETENNTLNPLTKFEETLKDPEHITQTSYEDEFCPNKFYEDHNMMIGEFREWEEYERSAYAKLNLWEDITEDTFKYDTITCGRYYNIVVQKHCSEDRDKWILIISHHLGFIMQIRSVNGDKFTKSQYSDHQLIKTIEEQIENKYNPQEKKIPEEKQETPKEKTTDVQPLGLDIQKEAYDLSSELFHFKDLRRGVVEHGKVCFIEGYKKHAELFYNFLRENGYFSNEELTNILAEFDHYLTGKPCVTISSAEQVFGKLYPWLPQDSCLTMVQKDIVELYRSLDKTKHTLLIQKPRQKGVTTICKIIAYMEAKNGKNVLYLGYGPNDKMLQDIKNVTYLNANNEASVRRCIGKKFDLIIVDEMITFTIPIKTEQDLYTALSENGKMIIVGTPLEPEWRNYNAMKNYFTSYNTTGEVIGQKIVYTIHPDRHDYEKAERYPECKNEILGQWNDKD